MEQKRKTLIINFTGGPGSGKTALCCQLFAEMKMRGMKVEYVPEVAKNLVWTKQFELLNNQHYVSMTQFELLKAVNGKVDYILTDGPLVHGIFYNRHNKDNYCNVKKVEKMIISAIETFDNIFIHVVKGDFKYETAGRLQSEEESKLIGSNIKKVLDCLNFPYKTVISGRKALDDVIYYVENVAKSSEQKVEQICMRI